MRKPPLRLAGLLLGLLAAVQLSAQTVAETRTGPTNNNNNPEIAPTTGSSTTSAPLARSFTVTREFTSTDDAASIDVAKGTVSYQVYVRAYADAPWKLVHTQSPVADTGAQVSYPDSYEIKIMLTADCADCASVVFRQ